MIEEPAELPPFQLKGIGVPLTDDDKADRAWSFLRSLYLRVNTGGVENAVCGALEDIQHFCRQEGVDFARQLEAAKAEFQRTKEIHLL